MINQDMFKEWANWTQMGKSTFEPLHDAQKLNSPIAEGIMRENLSLYSDNIGSFVKYMQHLSKTTRAEDFAKTQLEFWAEQSERNLQYGQNILKLCEDGIRDYEQWLEEKITPVFKEARHAAKEAEKAMHHKKSS